MNVRGGINHEACRVYESEGFETVFVIPCVQMSHVVGSADRAVSQGLRYRT
jgi:hypothetical protein